MLDALMNMMLEHHVVLILVAVVAVAVGFFYLALFLGALFARDDRAASWGAFIFCSFLCVPILLWSGHVLAGWYSDGLARERAQQPSPSPAAVRTPLTSDAANAPKAASAARMHY